MNRPLRATPAAASWKSSFLRSLLVIIAGWAGLGASASSMVQKQYFSLILPKGFQIADTAPMMDFDVYTVTKDGKPFVGIYVGNQPKFPRFTASAESTVTYLKAPGFEMVSLWEKDRLAGREILVELNASHGWPARIHAWTAQLPLDQMAIADKILSSIIVAGGNATKH